MSRPSRWWLVIGSLRSGGTERQVVSLASALVARGESVSLAVIDGRHSSAYAVDGRVRVLALSQGGGFGYLSSIVRLAWLIRSGDIVYSFLDAANLLAIIASLGRRVRLIAGVRDSNVANATLSRAAFRAARVLSSRIDVIIGNASTFTDFYLARGYRPRAVAVVSNGIDASAWRPDAGARASVREELKVAEDALIVGFVARVDAKKRHDLMLEAFSICHVESHLVIVGRGTAEDRVIADGIARLGIAERVHVLGERNDLPRLTAAFDIASCISDFEGFPNSMLEAMACGVACVATDVGDVAKVIADAGVIVEPDSEKIAATLDRLLADHVCRARMGSVGRGRALEQYSVEAMTDATVAAAGG